jgi:uncharacterized protein (DUF4213/DUF364 family)
MTVLDDLLAGLPAGGRVRDVLVGRHLTVVSSLRCGLASTLAGHGPHGHHPVRDVGKLERKRPQELATWARSDNALEASLGVAAINSLIEPDHRRLVEANALQLLVERGRDRNVALIGHFPFIPDLREAARDLWVIEQDPAEDEHPASAAADLLPKADVVAITGSTLINHTLEALLSRCRPRAFVMILGPSTPLSPILFDHGVSALSGIQVDDEESVLRTIRQGAGFRQVEGLRLVVMIRDRPG